MEPQAVAAHAMLAATGVGAGAVFRVSFLLALHEHSFGNRKPGIYSK
jgi:hypothetical protein